MKTTHVIIVCIVCLFTFSRAWAHALWIETAPTGKLGKEHQVRIYYGEPAEGVLEQVADWWSDVGSFSLTLHLPDGSSRKLVVTAQSDHYVSTFIPERSGIYALSIAQPVAETFDGHKYQFNGTAFVNVGAEADRFNGYIDDFRLSAPVGETSTIGKAFVIDARLDGQPLNALEVTVFSPNGWHKTFHTDGNGSISFVPDRAGHYLIEALHSVEVMDADHEHLHRIATWSLKID